MAISKSTPAAPLDAVTHSTRSSNADILKLRSIVQEMDCLSQGGFSRIAAVAKLALTRLETPAGHQHIEDIANVLELIWGTADDVQNCINHAAETVGCCCVDESEIRRREAGRQAREADREMLHG